MAKITNVLTTAEAKGNREDLSDVIYNIDPTATPIMTAIGVGDPANAITFDWQTDTLAPADPMNAQDEGFRNENSQSAPTTRENNVCQISKKDATVSRTQEKVRKAGRRSEMAYQMAKRSKELKIDIETILSGAQAMNDGTGGTARRTRGFEHFLLSNVSAGAGYVAPASKTAPLTDGTQRPLTETLLLDLLQKTWDNGGEPTQCYVNSYNKRIISTFKGRENSRVKIDKDEVVQSVDFYLSDFGEIKIIPSRHHRARTALLIDPTKAKLRYLDPIHSEDLAKVGDAETKMLVAEWGLEVSNEKAHGKIADLTTSA